MNAEFFTALDMLEKTKGIPSNYMIERIEAALQNAVKKETGSTGVRVMIDKDKKDFKVFQQKNVVEEVTDPANEISLEDAKKVNKRYVIGSVCEIEMKTKNFGRLSAQAAKQVIIQGIREAKRTNMVKEYERKREEIVSAIVTAVDDSTGDVRVDTGTSEATLPKSEQIPGEYLSVGDRIKVFITEVNRTGEGPVVTLSRTHPNMVKRMFELVVPEIQEGIVIIKSIAREPGSRSKLAVFSRDESVDPIGACIGPNGMRITEVVEELRGEKIDIVNYYEKPELYIASALSPAVVREVEFDGERSAKVLVDSEQLSLAIGKEGQNARLAARLTGYKIDIKGTK